MGNKYQNQSCPHFFPTAPEFYQYLFISVADTCKPIEHFALCELVTFLDIHVYLSIQLYLFFKFKVTQPLSSSFDSLTVAKLIIVYFKMSQTFYSEIV